jgi:thymidylate synthase (FAD)
MKVTLLHNTPLYIAAHGARTCWDSGDKSDTEDARCEYIEDSILSGGYATNTDNIIGSNDAALIDRVGNKFKHQSILEHVSYNLYIEGVSRALLQELARHRISSLSVKSTRYTLKELKGESSFITDITKNDGISVNLDRAEKYLVFTGDWSVDYMSVLALENLRKVLINGVSNDKAKYCLPESYKTELTWSINMRSLQNFISLRSDKSALWEIQQLAHKIYEALPEEHKYMYKNYIKNPTEED